MFVIRKQNRYLLGTSTCTGFPDRHTWTTDIKEARRYMEGQGSPYIPKGARIVNLGLTRSEMKSMAREALDSRKLQRFEPGEVGMALALLVRARRLIQNRDERFICVALSSVFDSYDDHDAGVPRRIFKITRKLQKWIEDQLDHADSTYANWLSLKHGIEVSLQDPRLVQGRLNWIDHMRAQLREHL